MPLLEKDDGIEKIIGLDRVKPPEDTSWKKLEFHQVDIRDSDLKELVQYCDVMVHLAFILMRLPGVEEIDDVNIQGTQNVIRITGELGIPKLIITSSVVGYGLHKDNPSSLTEESPLRPNEDLYYSRAKATNEIFLDSFIEENPNIIVTRLRPCTVVGPNADPAQMAQMLLKTLPVVKGFDPPVQLLHEQDLAQALHLVIREDLPGIFNVTSDEPRSLTELVTSRGGKVLQLPYFAMKSFFNIAWRSKATVFAPEWVDLSRYSIVASNEKLKGVGWEPQYTTQDSFNSVLDAFGGVEQETFSGE